MDKNLLQNSIFLSVIDFEEEIIYFQRRNSGVDFKGNEMKIFPLIIGSMNFLFKSNSLWPNFIVKLLCLTFLTQLYEQKRTALTTRRFSKH